MLHLRCTCVFFFLVTGLYGLRAESVITTEYPKNSSYFKDTAYFPRFSRFNASLEQIAADYPDLCMVTEIGRSVRERPILAVKISDNVTEQENEPEFICTGALHGDEPYGMLFLARLIEYLCTQYHNDSCATSLSTIFSCGSFHC